MPEEQRKPLGEVERPMVFTMIQVYQWYIMRNHGIIMVLSWYYHDIIMVLSWYHHGIIMVLSLYDHEKSTCSSMIIHDHTISHHGFDPWFYSYE